MFFLYLAVITAESVAALGSLGQGAFVTAAVSLSGALLQDRQTETALSCFLHLCNWLFAD